MPAFRTSVRNVRVVGLPGRGKVDSYTADTQGMIVSFTGTVAIDDKPIGSPKQLRERWQHATRKHRDLADAFAGGNPADRAARARLEGQSWAYGAAVYALSNSSNAARAAGMLRQIIDAFVQQAPASFLNDEWLRLRGTYMVYRAKLLLAELETAATVQWMEE